MNIRYSCKVHRKKYYGLNLREDYKSHQTLLTNKEHYLIVFPPNSLNLFTFVEELKLGDISFFSLLSRYGLRQKCKTTS